jgi:trk system potassium uptake protein TrkH
MIFVPATTDISNREGFFIVVSGWLLSCLIGALPYILWGGEFNLTNAWFESVSGYTTTGSTILTDIEALPPGLLFWRSSTHFIGGMGIIIFMLSVLPSMGRAGMVLYRTEFSSLASENFHFRTKQNLKILLYVYLGLTITETVSLLVCGLTPFDAVTHAFGTIATGGFSPKNISLAYYQSLSVEIVVMVFMILSGIHFGLLFIAVNGKFSDLFKSSAVRYYLLAMLTGTIISTLFLYKHPYDNLFQSLRYASFQVISLGTSTGFATTDTNPWPPLVQLILIFFTLQCACAGSTSGGIKADRIVIFYKTLFRRITKMQHPRAVIVAKIDGKSIDEDILEASSLFIALYLGVVFLSTLLLAALGVDIMSAFSGSAAAMGNVGPGFGLVGSMNNFSLIPETGKWILSLTMLMGRLEIFGFILFILFKTWK